MSLLLAPIDTSQNFQVLDLGVGLTLFETMLEAIVLNNNVYRVSNVR